MGYMAKSRRSALNLLRKIYAGTNSNTLPNGDMFKALGKDLAKPNDRAYVATQVSLLKSYGLITPDYSRHTGHRERVSITLTQEGRRMLEDHSQASSLESASHNITVTLPQIEQLVREWERQNKGWVIPVEPQKSTKGLPMEQR